MKKKEINIKDYSGFNLIGFFTLYRKEIKRFLNVGTQTLIAPAVTTLLFYIIFIVALGRGEIKINLYDFSEFLAPGLICMAILQNAFANTSSSILISKVQGNIVDILMPPLSQSELTFAFALGGITRGLLVGIIVAITIYSIVPLKIYSLFCILYFSISSALFLSLLGIFCGVWSQKFDHMAALTNFVITPLAFLSGVFYTIDKLPSIFQTISFFNPFFHIINIFRYGFIGVSDGSIFFGMIYLPILALLAWFLAFILYEKGYKIKS